MTIERQSQTGLLLPGVFRGEPLLEDMLQAGERPLLGISAQMEALLAELRPETAPAAWLPWLFWALGGEDYYRPDWDETRQRLVLSRLVELYRSRGTVDGLGLHLRLLADLTLLRAIQPPAKAFAGVSLTAAERAQWESRHPEIRIWPFQHAGVRRSAFIGRGGGYVVAPEDVPTAAIGCFPAATDAADRIGDRLEWHDPQAGGLTADKAAVKRGADGVIELRIRGRAVGAFLGRWLAGWTVDHGAARRLYRITPDPVGGRDPLALQPSLTPMRVSTEEVRVAGSGRGFWLWNRYRDTYADRGGSFVGMPLVARHAEQRLGQSLRLFDPARAGSVRRGGHPFLGAVALGTVPAHEIEAWVEMRGTSGRGTIWPGRPLRGHLATSDATRRLAHGRWAGGLARRAGCRINLNISHRRAIRCRETILAGAVRVGDYVMSGGA